VSKDWREPKIARFDPLEDANKEQIVRDLQAKGHKLQWINELRLREAKRNGWKPVVERDLVGRPTVFMDRLSELILVHRPRQSNRIRKGLPPGWHCELRADCFACGFSRVRFGSHPGEHMSGLVVWKRRRMRQDGLSSRSILILERGGEN